MSLSTRVYTSHFIGLLVLVALIVSREPLFFISPRIWAEEGSVYIQSFITQGFWTAFLQPHLGYYSLFNNLIAGVALTLSPDFKYIAHWTTYSSMVIMIATAACPFFLESDYWKNTSNKIAISLFIILASNGEIWLNTINSQFYLCTFCCLTLLSNWQSISIKQTAFTIFFLLMGMCTGVTSLLLAPFFLVKFLNANNRSNFSYLLLLCVAIGVSLQIFAFIHQLGSGEMSRLNLDNLSNFFLGLKRTFMNQSPTGLKWLFLIYLAIAVFHLTKGIDSYLPFIVSIYICLAFTFLSLGMGGGNRYGYAPNILVFIFLLSNTSNENNWLRKFSYLLCICMFWNALDQYPNTFDFYNPSWTKFNLENLATGSNNQQYIKLFPQWEGADWKIILNPKN